MTMKTIRRRLETLWCIGDLHLGNHRLHGGPTVSGLNTRFQYVTKALREAFQAIPKSQYAAVAILGDLFDTARPSPQMIDALMDVLSNLSGEHNIYVVAGNHDKASEAAGDNALTCLRHLNNVTVIDTEPVALEGQDINWILSPFRTGPASEWLLSDIANAPVNTNPNRRLIVCTHVGLISKDTPPWLRGSDDAVDIELILSTGAEIVAGNWHSFNWSHSGLRDNAIQIGALVPTGFDNPSVIGEKSDPYGKLVCTTYSSISCQVPSAAGPRFWQTILGQHTATDLINWFRKTRNTNFLRIVCDSKEVSDARALGGDLVQRGIIKAYDIVVSAQDRQNKRDAVARAVKDSTSIAQAVSTFTRKMELGENVTHEEVAARTNQYIEKS